MKTRKQMRGGKRLGEGLRGIVHDLCTSYDKESFCNELDYLKNSLTKITLYTMKSDTILSSKSDLLKFVEFLNKQKEKLAKIFKATTLFLTKSAEYECNNELEINRKIISIYKSQMKKYLTIDPLQGGILGAKIESERRSPIFVLFGSKCDNHYSVHLPSFLKDIIESIAILQKSHYLHNDIKPDNIVLCDNRYKLIDWGAASEMKKESAVHAKVSTSPIRWYCNGYSEFISTSYLSFRARHLFYDAYKSKLFQELNNNIMSEFKIVMARKLSRTELFEKYKDTFDLFMIGMTLFYLIYDKPEYHKKYIPIIYKLTSMIDPFKNAKEALSKIL
jgi:serine/threonine protein kinase